MNRWGFVWFTAVMRLTGWLPDLTLFMRLRGLLVRSVMQRCGRNFQIGANVVILSPHRVSVGNDVYLACGSWIQGHGGVLIEDEVMLGPYTVLASSNHQRHGDSFRFGAPQAAPIVLRRGSWTGAHVTITGGVTVGAGGACAANAVVTTDVPSLCTVGGVPARPLA